MAGLIYITDRKRHLICIPYSVENLHRMAEELGLKRGWFHKNHYDIPKRRIDEIEKKCKIVNSRVIVDIINHPHLGDDIISGGQGVVGKPTGPGFEVTVLKEKGVID